MIVGTGRRRKPAARAADAERDRARDAQLIAAVREHGDTEAMQALVTEYLGLVRRIAGRHAVSGEQVDDLVQEGVVGLLKAIRRFELERGVPFPAYAGALVAGEIRHHLRDRSSCVRLPESVQELQARLDLLAVEGRAETGREPSIAELAARAGVSVESAVQAIAAGVGPLEDEPPVTETEFHRSEVRADLDESFACLDEREREVVYLRFFVDLTQDEIAKCLGISQMHVSRILRGALETMRRSTMD